MTFYYAKRDMSIFQILYITHYCCIRNLAFRYRFLYSILKHHVQCNSTWKRYVRGNAIIGIAISSSHFPCLNPLPYRLWCNVGASPQTNQVTLNVRNHSSFLHTRFNLHMC